MNDKRSIVAIALCIIFYIAYTQYLSMKYPNQGRTAQQTAPTTQEGAAPTPGETAPGATSPGTTAETPPSDAAPVQRLADDQLVIETDTTVYRFSQETGGLASVSLKGYTERAPRRGEDPGMAQVIDHPLALHGVVGANAPAPTTVPVYNAERDGRSIRFWRDHEGFRIAQEYRIPERGYAFDVEVTYQNQTGAPVDLTAGIYASETIVYKKGGSPLGFLPGVPMEQQHLVLKVDTSIDRHEVQGFCDDGKPVRLLSSPVRFIGFDKHYFLGVLLPKQPSMNVRADYAPVSRDSCRISYAVFEPQGIVQPGAAASLAFGAYFGPKDLQVLPAYDPQLESSVDFGIFGFIARPLLLVIQGFHRLFQNYGVAIVLLTICLKILFYPLMKSSTESMFKMKKLQPQMKALQERYKDDRARLNQELMKFYGQHKINPMKGCLPILPQIPVFFAFYQVLANAIELRHAPFFGWIQDLSAMDPYFVTPILMGVAMVVQQKLTPTTGMDKTQEKILMFMPIMFTVMMLTLPAGLTLYMLTNTVVGIAQMKWLYRKLEAQAPEKAPPPAGAKVKAKA